MIVIGRSESIAWGFTTTHADTQDVVVERLAGPDAYGTEHGPQPFAVREERLRVLFGGEEVLRVRETRHGPVVSDLADTAPQGTVHAVAMANLLPGDTAAAGLLALNRARSLAEARAAAALISAPSQNLIVADSAGAIGLFVTGRIPDRRAGDGSLPVAGHAAPAWRGMLPFEALPHLERPPSGMVANVKKTASRRPDTPPSSAATGMATGASAASSSGCPAPTPPRRRRRSRPTRSAFWRARRCRCCAASRAQAALPEPPMTCCKAGTEKCRPPCRSR